MAFGVHERTSVALARSASRAHTILFDGRGRANATRSLQAAIDAASANRFGYRRGPTGSPQGVVRIRAGSYRILNVKLRSNVRLEISAGAVLKQAGGPTAHPARLFVLDGPAAAPLRNVSIVGVGISRLYGRHHKPTAAAGWSIRRDFTLNLDPVSTHGSPWVRGIALLNVSGFLIQRVFIIQNGSRRSGRPPDSQTAAIGLKSDTFSPLGGPYYDPRNGAIRNVYAVGEPGGFGPDQIDSAHNVLIKRIYSR